MRRQSMFSVIKARERTYFFKEELYKNGRETVENLIQVFRVLLDIEIDYFEIASNYLGNIKDLDGLCGVYFKRLGIEIK